ncbi:DsbC family protein [Motiliproteus coralliicola]|uniref:Thiol:disulfide interchange protein n=1 Tax=Motiliproteus coralliicola TaxID=2283196 RepID=A0A369WEJ5_9GAMM|nr:DsbC family protein [Motiliproteus coralliicola]RDE19761.1 DsbC family protein [Motiliproteus coralliicola]
MRLSASLFSLPLSLSLLLGSSLLSAAEVSDSQRKLIVDKLQQVNPMIEVSAVKPSVIEGVVEVELSSGETLFSSPDASHFVLGNLYQLKKDRFVNLSKKRKDQYRAEALKGLDSDTYISFPAKGETKAVVYAFTDVDCGYCRKLHSEMEDYNKQGIEVRYLAFPRAGIGSGTYRQMVSVWCADDQHEAMTQSKSGARVASKSCDNPVADHYDLGQRFGVTGTPALVLESGRLMPGYLPAARLAAEIDDQS